ncbi:hypothetical protein [Helicobacter brantae]|uniref:Uncharacterized protein n=1 Tax=Helicobacter brantae TaxID=375927 RepID=A0A3D8J4M7_9HELI|nr:hypothetical protein [Helicobacter brantae]RDU71834.1 hypothetical protein CQA58_01980 [Helicobacter brantae]
MQRVIRMAFVLVDSKLRLFKIEHQMEEVKKEGERLICVDENFWEWWKQEMDYVKDDVLDLCFVWDKQDEILHNGEFFSAELQSDFWNQREVLNLLRDLGIDAKVVDSRGKLLKDSKKSSLQLYSNIVWSEFIQQPSKQKEVICKDDEGKSPAWWYFENKRRERERRRG